MGNPAKELALYLERWKTVPRGINVYELRGLDESNKIEFWREQVKVTRLLAEVEAAITSLGSQMDVSHYLRSVESWYTAVIGPDFKWGETLQTDREFASQTAIDQLNSLGDVINLLGQAQPISAADSGVIIQVIDELAILLADETLTLSSSERQYIFELLASIRIVCQEQSTLGSSDLPRRINELIGAITQLASTLVSDGDISAARKFWSAVSKVFRFGTFGARLIALGVDVAANLHELES